MSHAVRITTSVAISAVEAWCEANCKAPFDVRIAGLSDDLRRKTLELYFESAEDLTAFKDSYKTIGRPH
ncbi:hypothetical protein CKO38_11420 [Rhodospirillum rubrum]|uniref:hypothetical protein n=1 Tax=Rhodospirillum rubrum TaxID=1085 RepID=UPI0019047117|nr:hypothetical protein [Rhodospirillum rubrum]MBK1664992.1 hypothetical protein [Rhodospirillum rubrum]MBK1677263.1 hypothetical protein [Rhodospirillum rubrum]